MTTNPATAPRCLNRRRTTSRMGRNCSPCSSATMTQICPAVVLDVGSRHDVLPRTVLTFMPQWVLRPVRLAPGCDGHRQPPRCSSEVHGRGVAGDNGLPDDVRSADLAE